MQAILVMFRSDGERRSFSITRDMTVVGRREDCDLRIPLNEVSRKHCRLVRDGDTLRLEDLGSSNGTFLNGQRVQEAILQPGDSVQIGPVVFVLQVDGVPADEELNPISAAMVEANEASPGGEHMAAASTENEVADLVEGLDPLPMGGGEEVEPLEFGSHQASEPHAAASPDEGLDDPMADGSEHLTSEHNARHGAHHGHEAPHGHEDSELEPLAANEGMEDLDDMGLLHDEPIESDGDDALDIDFDSDTHHRPHA